jgi:putative transposase
MIDREHDLPITKQADILRISRGSVYYLPRSVSATDLEVETCRDHLGLACQHISMNSPSY